MYIQNIQGQSESWERVEMCWSQYWVFSAVSYLALPGLCLCAKYAQLSENMDWNLPRYSKVRPDCDWLAKPRHVPPTWIPDCCTCWCQHTLSLRKYHSPVTTDGWQMAWSLEINIFLPPWTWTWTWCRAQVLFSPSNYPGCYSWLTDKLKSWFPPLLKTSLC